jgi:SAM-dependent methyltransferase
MVRHVHYPKGVSMFPDKEVHPLDAAALRVFAEKGREGERDYPQLGNANAVKVRRVIQLTRDLAAKDFPELRILDLACGEGVYAVEAGLRGAHLTAVDGRTERMDYGAAIARRMGLSAVRFEQLDIRHVTRATHGTFDVVYLLGVLYHLDTPDVFSVLENVRALSHGLVVIDTHVALEPDCEAEHRGRRYAGTRCREHGDTDSDPERRARLLMSLDNTFSFWFAKNDLVRLLVDIGFSGVLEAHAPLEPGKPKDRVTLVATAGRKVAVSTYPWVNGLTEDAIAASLGSEVPGSLQPPPPHWPRRCFGLVNRVLRQTMGIEMRRL